MENGVMTGTERIMGYGSDQMNLLELRHTELCLQFQTSSFAFVEKEKSVRINSRFVHIYSKHCNENMK